MYILVIGCSEVGYHLVKALLSSNHEVVVVEKNWAKFQLLNQELGDVAFHGDGTDKDTLKNAGGARADILIAATSRDEVNLVACQVAKHVFQTENTIALIRDPKNEPVFRVLGVDTVVNATHLILEKLEEWIPGRPLSRLINLGSTLTELVSITVPEDARVVGKRLGEVELPPRSFISVVVKRNGVERPAPDLILEPDDQLIAVTPSSGEATLYEVLTGI